MLTNRSVPTSPVIPALVYPDVRAAVAWVTAAFGFVECVRIGEDPRSERHVGVDGGSDPWGRSGEQQPPERAS